MPYIQELILKKFSKNSRKKVAQVGKAEAKILFVVCYYVILGMISLVTFTYIEATNPSNLSAIEEYFVCQRSGFHPSEGNQCGERPSVRLFPLNILSAVGILQLALLPVVILIFTVSCTKPNCQKWKKISRRNN